MSNPSSGPSKLGNASSPAVSPAPSQLGVTSNDSALRRSGGSGSSGAGQSTRSFGGQPRNKQVSRNQHKQSRRYQFADEDAMAESAAMRSFTNRKGQTSITHLMNFELPPRPSNQYHPNNHRYAKRNPTWGLGSGYHAVDKARYVHANYRFIVDPGRDYRVQSTDADVYIEWGSILQILASPVSQSAACPICLGDPVAPRMAKCGHMFCLHCLIRYMHSADDTGPYPEKKARWKKCPICWDAIYGSDLRPVRWYQGQEQDIPREGADIVLRLVARPAGSTLALPKEASGSSLAREDEQIPWHYAADVMDFARVMKGTGHYMRRQYDDEIEQLEQLERHDELMFGEDTEWTSKAVRSIRDAKERMRELSASGGLQRPEPSKRRITEPTTAPNAADAVTAALSTSITAFRAQQHPEHLPQAAPLDYYFYQALLHYYLSPLDIRILRSAFGSFSNFPTTILPRIERISTGHVVDDELRRRAKYLAHLPHGCEVSFLECDWTDTVPATVLETFKVDIEKRRKRNTDKDAREERERLRAEREEDEQRWAAVRRRRPNSADRDPDMLNITPQALQGLPGNATNGEHGTGAESPSPSWTSLAHPRIGANGCSFASLASPSTSPNESRTVWGTAAIAPLRSSPNLPATESMDRGTPDDGWLQGWETDLLDNDTDVSYIAQARSLSLSNELSSVQEGSSRTTAHEASTAGAAASSSKKKKGKKITLMSTNARRGA